MWVCYRLLLFLTLLFLFVPVKVRNSFTVCFTASPSCTLSKFIPSFFAERSGSHSIVCLFRIAFRDEELQGKVSWQLIPGQRFETASYNLIRNHLCTLTSPLNLGFTDTLSSFSPCSLHIFPPPASSLFVLLLCFFLVLSPLLDVSWWSGGFSWSLSLTPSTFTRSLLQHRRHSELLSTSTHFSYQG